MIIVYVMGGLGNQLFQYASARRLAHKHNTELKIDKQYFDNDKLHPYRLDQFNINEKIATPDDLNYIARKVAQRGVDYGVERVNGKDILNYPDDVYLRGYWSREEYFMDIADILREELTPRETSDMPEGEMMMRWREKILAAECSVSLHIRHGDYIISPVNEKFYGLLPFEYYQECVDILKRQFGNITVFVFSNNLHYAQKHLKLGVRTEYVDGCKDFEDIYLMSLCHHNIKANSTFSWWGAWLNKNPDKKVFTPEWINKPTTISNKNNPSPEQKRNKPSLDSDRWIKINADFTKQPAVDIRPVFSLIVVADNDISNVADCLNSLLVQDFLFYEIIIIDNASVDGSDSVCEEIARDKSNVTFIRLYEKVSKHEAWNRGLEFAQGQYVMFLKGSDRFIINSLGKLYLVNEHMVMDIMSAFSYLEENAAGTVVINDKRFAVQIDKPFYNLKDAIQLNIDSIRSMNVTYQEASGIISQLRRNAVQPELDNRLKMQLLAAKEFNNFLGTRIFKRSFLLENNIKFKPEMNELADVSFLIESMCRTKRILFVPQVFFIASRPE